MLKVLSAVFVLVGIACAQVYIPTGVSTQSGIVRNVPTQIVRIPADTYINDGRQTYIAAQVPLQLYNNNNNNNRNNNLYATNANTHNNRQFQSLNVREENLRRLIESEARLRDLLLLADQDNDNNNRNNYNTNVHNKNNNRFTTTDTFGTIQDQTYTDNNNDNINFNRNTQQGTLLNRGQLRTLVATTNRDTGDLTQQYRTNTDTLRDTSLQRLRDTTLLGRL